jgi:putative endonuclease
MENGSTQKATQGTKTHFVYIVRCRDGTLYTGYTTDLDRRIAVHNRGKGARYTRARLPVELVFCEEYRTKSEAMRREAEIKRMPRWEKAALVAMDVRVTLKSEGNNKRGIVDLSEAELYDAFGPVIPPPMTIGKKEKQNNGFFSLTHPHR